MKGHERWTGELGELVVAAFDRAARLSSDPREVSRVATAAVERLLGPEYRLGRSNGPARVEVDR